MENTVELRQIVGKFFDRDLNKERSVAWDMDMVLLNGRQIATINRVPGAPIGILGTMRLTPKEEKAVADAIAAARGGVPPKHFGYPVQVPFTLLDDDEDDDV